MLLDVKAGMLPAPNFPEKLSISVSGPGGSTAAETCDMQISSSSNQPSLVFIEEVCLAEEIAPNAISFVFVFVYECIQTRKTILCFRSGE